MGGLALPPPAGWDVLVSTPKAFQMALLRHPHLAWTNLCVAVFDEVHHVLKEHPYRQIALQLNYALPMARSAPRIVGLTASMPYAVDEKKVLAVAQRLCSELRI